jgi:hypothetical protein
LYCVPCCYEFPDKDNKKSQSQALIHGKQYKGSIIHIHHHNDYQINISMILSIHEHIHTYAYTIGSPFYSIPSAWNIGDNIDVTAYIPTSSSTADDDSGSVKQKSHVNLVVVPSTQKYMLTRNIASGDNVNDDMDIDVTSTTTMKQTDRHTDKKSQNSTSSSFFSRSVTSIDDLQVGKSIRVKLIEISDVYLNVSLGDTSPANQVIGKIHACYVKSSHHDDNDHHPLKAYKEKIGEFFGARIISVKQRQSDSTDDQKHSLVVQLSMLPRGTVNESAQSSLTKYTLGQTITAYIKVLPTVKHEKNDHDHDSNNATDTDMIDRTTPMFVSAAPNIKGRIKKISLERLKYLSIGQSIECIVQDINIQQKFLELKLISSSTTKQHDHINTNTTASVKHPANSHSSEDNKHVYKAVESGDILKGSVVKVLPHVLIIRLLPSKLIGKVHITVCLGVIGFWMCYRTQIYMNPWH